MSSEDSTNQPYTRAPLVSKELKVRVKSEMEETVSMILHEQ